MKTEMIKNKLVRIQSDAVEIEGMLELPEHPIGIVLFAHGSGSSRFSQRNNYVAEALRTVQIGTLLLDLLTPKEDEEYQTRFNIPLLTQRLHAAGNWLRSSEVASLPIALFGASTGAAAALQVAADLGDDIAAVVSRGGRPDLAGHEVLEKVTAPTLLIVGGDDTVVIDLNREAYAHLHCEKKLEIIPGATHLFEESGKLQTVASLAVQWCHWHFDLWNKNQRKLHVE
ncbi:MAG: dienelactone hydrolase family protein [Undibacterium sp.]|jgi:putative phosphoribosyl transferase|nr:dienelactone hydrolase family protein [Undibacterium sp.]